MDCSNPFKRVGLPREWDADFDRVDFPALAIHVRFGLKDGDRGAILSFPTTYRFTREQLDIAAAWGIPVVILWGPFDCCAKIRRERQEASGKGTPSARRYERLNKPTFEMYSRGEYEHFRVDTFDANCLRRPYEAVLADIAARITNQGIELTADA